MLFQVCRGTLRRAGGEISLPVVTHYFPPEETVCLARLYSAMAAGFALPAGFIHEKADAPPIGLADRGRPAPAFDPALVLLVVLRASRGRLAALVLTDLFGSHRMPLLEPLSLPAALLTWLLRRCSPLVRGGGAGS